MHNHKPVFRIRHRHQKWSHQKEQTTSNRTISSSCKIMPLRVSFAQAKWKKKYILFPLLLCIIHQVGVGSNSIIASRMAKIPFVVSDYITAIVWVIALRAPILHLAEPNNLQTNRILQPNNICTLYRQQWTSCRLARWYRWYYAGLVHEHAQIYRIHSLRIVYGCMEHPNRLLHFCRLKESWFAILFTISLRSRDEQRK